MRRQLRSPWRPDGLLGLAIAISIAVTYVLWLFPEGFITGDATWWHAQREDISQYLAGLNAYLREDWSLPLLSVESIIYPEGTNAIFLDVIPAYALLLKIFVPNSALPINPYGWWLAASLTLPALFAWLITREMRLPRWGALVALTVFVVTFPALTHRFGHISLTSQWLLLWGILLYLRGHHRDRVSVVGWAFLLTLALYINLYIAAMVSALYLVSVLSIHTAARPSRNLWPSAIPPLVAAATLALTVLPLSGSASAGAWGFGYYSMNLLAPVTGGYILEIPGNPIAHAGQGEGFNYLGLGIIGLFSLSIWLLRHELQSTIRAHRWFMGLAVLLTLYALSSQVYFGTVHILTNRLFDPFSPITSMFRSSGRFFWLVGYVIAVFSVLTLSRRLRRRAATVTLLVFSVIQLVDLQHHHERILGYLSRPATGEAEVQSWESLIPEGTDHLVYMPLFGCQEGPPTDLLPAMRFAVAQGLTINTGYVARHSSDCSTDTDELDGIDPDRTVLFFDKDDYPSQAMIARDLPDEIRTCHDGESVWICTP